MRNAARTSLFVLSAIAGLADERPYAIEDTAYTIEPRRFAIEVTPLTYARRTAATSDEVDTHAWSFGYSILRAGVAPDTEVGTVFESWTSSRTSDRATGAHERSHGTGAVSLRLKQNLFGNDGGRVACAFTPYVRLPSGSGDGHIDRTECGFALPTDFAIAENWAGLVVVYADWLANSSAIGRHFESSILVDVSRTFAINWNVLVECYYQTHAERGASPIGTVNVGLGRYFSSEVYAEAGTMIGVTRAANDAAFYLSFGRRF